MRVTAKPQRDWKPKDCEERAVPIPERLVEELRAFHKRNASSALLFPNQLDQPDGHFLVEAALKADCNCGHCINKTGKSCKDEPVCSLWSLHKFRRTFATMHDELEFLPALYRHGLGTQVSKPFSVICELPT